MIEKNGIRVNLIDSWNGDADIAHSAWVSTASTDNRTNEDIERVVNNIVMESHDTPKEAVWLRFDLHVPIFVERQLDKYRMTQQKQNMIVEYDYGKFGRDNITQNELSLRYRTMKNDWLNLPDDIIEVLNDNDLSEFVEKYTKMMMHQDILYNDLMVSLRKKYNDGDLQYSELKRIREVYRGVLGTSYMTDMQLILNLNAFEHILNQRISPHAQPETMLTCQLMLEELVNKNTSAIAINKMIQTNNWLRYQSDDINE